MVAAAITAACKDMPHNYQQGLYLRDLAWQLRRLLLPAKTHASQLPTRVIPAGSCMLAAAIAAACKDTCLTFTNKGNTCGIWHGNCGDCCCLQRHASQLPTRVIPAGSCMATAAIAAACKNMPHNCQQELYLQVLAWWLQHLLLPAKTHASQLPTRVIPSGSCMVAAAIAAAEAAASAAAARPALHMPSVLLCSSSSSSC
jgi:hypothetical protein